MNEQIVQVVIKGDRIIGLTASGHLARFDENLNVWIIQAKPEVFTAQNELVTTNNVPNARAMASHTPVKTEESGAYEIDSFGWIICIASAIGAVAVLISYLI